MPAIKQKIQVINDVFFPVIDYTILWTNSISIMFEILDITKDNVIAFKATGKIEEADYDKIIPLMEKTEREGNPVRLFIEIGDIK